MKRNLTTVLFLLISLQIMAQGPEGYLECGPEQNFEEPTNGTLTCTLLFC